MRDAIDPHCIPIRSLEAGTPFRYFGHRYVVEIEADDHGLIQVRDELGGSHLFTSLAMVERSE
jgi:hypothetical protein